MTVRQPACGKGADAGYGDITFSQGRVFQRVGPNGTRLTDLAEQVEAEWTEYLGARDMADLQRILARLREVTDPCA